MKKIVWLYALLSPLFINAQPWQKMADMPAELSFPVVVELRGNIHVMGGGGSSGATDLHLRYQPALNKWDTMAPVPYKAQQPAGAVLNGNIHFFGGGFPNTGTRLDKHYYYVADSNKWFEAAKLPVATAIHKAVSLDNKLYCLTGQPNKNLCQYFDADSNKWFSLNALPDANFWYGAVLAVGSNIYRFGGGGFSAPVVSSHKYTGANDNWSAIANLPQALHAPAASNIGDSAIFITGGYNAGENLKKVWIYNVRKDIYHVSEPFETGRSYHSLVTINGCLYSVGGSNDLVENTGVSLLKYCPPMFPLSDRADALQSRPRVIKNSEFFRVEKDAGVQDKVSISMYNQLGQNILDRQFGAHDVIQLNASEYTESVYFVYVTVGTDSWTEKWYK